MKKYLLYIFIIILFVMNIFIIIQNNNLTKKLEEERMRVESFVMSQINGMENRVVNTVRNVLRENEESWVKNVEFSVVKPGDEMVVLKGHFVLNGIYENVQPNIIYWPTGEIDEKESMAMKNEANGQFTATMPFETSKAYYYQINYNQDGKNIVSEPRRIDISRYSYQSYDLDYEIYFENSKTKDFKVFRITFNSEMGKKYLDKLNIKDVYLKIDTGETEEIINLYPEFEKEEHATNDGSIQIVDYGNFSTRAYIKVPLTSNEINGGPERVIYIENQELEDFDFTLFVEYGEGYIKEQKIIKNTQMWNDFIGMNK
ncbi:MAG: hypothetical protein ACQESN_08525 [Thermotogota bacterium]